MTRVRALFLFLSLTLCLTVGCGKAHKNGKNHAGRLLATPASSTIGPVSTGSLTAGVTGTATPPTSGGSATSSSNSTATANVGSPYWYEGDSFGNPFKTHSTAEDAMSRQVLILVNVERLNLGLRLLLPDAEAERAAKVHSEDMEGRGFFDHFTPEGWSPVDRLQMTGASGYTMAGENVAFGQQTPDEVMRAWMNSPGHRANILHPDYTHIGIGVAASRPYWTQVFLRR